MKLMLYFVIIFSFVFGDTIDDMKKKMEKINQGIEDSHKTINKISVQQSSVLQQIKDIEKDLEGIRAEHFQLQEEYEKLRKKTAYGEKNLEFSSKEIGLMEEGYRQKLVAWQKMRDERMLSGKKGGSMQVELRSILGEDEKRINSIKNVQNEIKAKKIVLESEKEQLGLLRNKLRIKQDQINRKMEEKNVLIGKLKNQKKYYEGRIVNLKNEKIKMEKEIDRIIRERAKAMKGKVDIITAKKYIGTLVKPVKGLIKIYFGQSTVGDVKSTGIEINSPIGSLVNASANGEVIYAGKFGNLGKMVMIDHGYSLITIYGNLISTNVKVGQQVDKNDKIGILGLSKDGDSNLYFETRFNLKSENPNIFF